MGRLEDVARGEVVERELDALIARRALKTTAEQELWEASAKKHRDRLRQELLRGRLRYHEAMLEAHTRNFQELLRRHRVGLRLCEEALGITEGEGVPS